MATGFPCGTAMRTESDRDMDAVVGVAGGDDSRVTGIEVVETASNTNLAALSVLPGLTLSARHLAS